MTSYLTLHLKSIGTNLENNKDDSFYRRLAIPGTGAYNLLCII